MKKTVAFTLAMMASSATFADSNKLSAFEGVESSAVSMAELNEVSGEGLLLNLLSTVGLLNVLPNITAQLALNGMPLTISSNELLVDAVGTVDVVLDDVVTTVDTVLDTVNTLVTTLDPSVTVGIGGSTISIGSDIQ